MTGEMVLFVYLDVNTNFTEKSVANLYNSTITLFAMVKNSTIFSKGGLIFSSFDQQLEKNEKYF